MVSFRSFFKWYFIFASLLLSQQSVLSQHSEIGAKVVLSGALMFGPYYSYWIDSHNSLNISTLAAYEEKLIFPFALNAGYNACFFNGKWRPKLGLQYSYLISPRKSKSPDDPIGVSIVSLVPGVQFQWAVTSQNVQSSIWLAHIFGLDQKEEKFKIFPIALDFSYGYKFR